MITTKHCNYFADNSNESPFFSKGVSMDELANEDSDILKDPAGECTYSFSC